MTELYEAASHVSEQILSHLMYSGMWQGNRERKFDFLVWNFPSQCWLKQIWGGKVSIKYTKTRAKQNNCIALSKLIVCYSSPKCDHVTMEKPSLKIQINLIHFTRAMKCFNCNSKPVHWALNILQLNGILHIFKVILKWFFLRQIFTKNLR